MQARERVQEARITVFSMICGSGRWKTKAAGAEPSGQMRNKKLHAAVSRSMFPRQNVQNPFSIEARLGIELSKKCTPLWREAHVEVKNVQDTTCSRHFWTLRRRFVFGGRLSTLDKWSGKSQNALVRGHQLCTQHFILEESLSQMRHVWCCQLRKLRKLRRIAFQTLPASKIEEVRRLGFDVWRCQLRKWNGSRSRYTGKNR